MIEDIIYGFLYAECLELGLIHSGAEYGRKVENMPDRENYQLTKERKKILRKMMSECLPSEDIVTFEYLVTIGWLEVLPREVVVTKIAKRKSILKVIIEQYYSSEIDDAEIYIVEERMLYFMRLL